MKSLTWQYDEFKQVGKDYGTVDEVEVYDSSHSDFRDIEAESNTVLDTLDLQSGATLVDFGSGTGTFALQAAKRGLDVHAVDVSEAMIANAKLKSDKAGVSNIQFHHAGFLTFEFPEEHADAVTTTFAFHHLPDFWKGIALKRIHKMLKPHGQLYLHDVILEETKALENIGAMIESQAAAGGDFLREDAEMHFRDEYSTYDWVMDGLFERAGFRIENKQIEGGVLGTYFCRKA